jgi:hypothetical protein
MSQESDINFEAEHMSSVGLSTVIDSIHEDEEEVTLIWFDPDMNVTDDIEKMEKNLWTVNVFLFPTDMDSCIADIKSREKEKIFLITSSNVASKLLPEIINFSQLDSIFLFPANRNEFNYLRDDFRKVVEIFENSNDLLISVKENIKQTNRQMEQVSFYDQHQQGAFDLSEQSSQFLW